MPVSIADVTNCTDMEGWNYQEKELYFGRVNIINYLASLEVDRKPSVAADFVGNFVIDTTAISDIGGFVKSKVSDIMAKSKVLTNVTKVAGAVSEAIKSSRPVEFFRSIGQAIKHKVEVTKDNLMEKLTKLIEGFCQNLITQLKKAYKDIKWVANYLTDIGLWLAASIIGDLSSLIPGLGYLQNAADLYKGVKKCVTGFSSYISMKLAGRGVTLNSGYPEVIARDLRSHMIAKGLLGLKDMAVKTGQIAMAAAGDVAAGIGSILSYVANVLGRVATLIDYIIQRVNLYKTCQTAEKEQLQLLNSSSIALDAGRFNDWFIDKLALSPILGALLLQSGSIAAPGTFLALLNSRGRLVSDAEANFQKGVVYINNMKSQSVSYIKEYSAQYSLEFKPGLAWQREILKQQLNPIELPEPPKLRRQGAIRRK